MKSKSAEKLLKDIQNLEILESIGDAVSIQDTNFKIIFQNKISKGIVGYHVGEYCYEAYTLRDKTCKDCPLAPVFADGKTHTVERNKPSDKGMVYLEITASPLRNLKGEIIAGIEVMRDITNRKETEERLKNSEEKFRNLSENSPNMIFINKKGRVVYANKKCEEIMGYKKEEFYSPDFNFHVLIAPQYLDTVSGNFQRHLKGEEVPPYEYTVVTKQGTVIEVIITTKLINYEGDTAILGIITDISEQKKTEETLRESEARFRKLVETAFEGIAIAENGIFLEANKLFAKLFEYTLPEIIGLHISKLVDPESLVDVMQKIQSGYDRPYEAVCVTKNGKHFPVEACGKAVIYNGRKARITALRDISGRKRSEEESIKIQKLESLGILAGGIAHDFNNLLTAILGNVSLAKMHINPEDKIYELLTEAEKASMRAKDLTQQLLTFSKGGEPVKKTVLLKGLVHDTSCFALRGSKTKSECRFPDNLWPVEIDEGQITQVFHNLIINADHAMPEGGVVDIHAENITSTADKAGALLMPGKYVKISVHDNGVGIPKDHLQKIFDPYFTTKQMGSGLGLTTAYSIIRKHDGAVTVESELGKGTILNIYLPASSKEIIFHEEITDTVSSGKGKILVMDDDDMVRDVAGAILRSLGYKVEFAKDGTEAIELYQKAIISGESFDVVIMDLTIPGGMGGKDAIKKLLNIDLQVKAVVSSGYSNDPIMSNYKAHGFSAVISKPYNVIDMSKTLHELINSCIH
ncbi:MAG TPA: hypothetical protein DEA95_00420 [Nitrospiraceae bacterium]|nr:hypothetical protein [Nitrospiraceae bacterium]